MTNTVADAIRTRKGSTSMRKVEVVFHDPKWRDAFTNEKQRLLSVFGDNVVAIHYVGSTAIPGIYAKPILDFLAEVKAIAKL